MEFATLVFQGKLPPPVAADDSSQILGRSLDRSSDRSSVRKELTMGGVSHPAENEGKNGNEDANCHMDEAG